MLCYGSKVSKEFHLFGTLFNGKPLVVSRLLCFVFVLRVPYTQYGFLSVFACL